MTAIAASDVPRLPRGVRMRFDAVRDAHILLAPERTFDLDATALAVLQLVDGTRSIADIATALAATYAADRSEIEADIIVMLNELSAKRVIET
jgi:pyrroloquinoline quinone biosynthesis protein D